MRKNALLVSVAAVLALGVNLEANALALGAISIQSALGEPLRAEIEVPQISSEEASTLTVNIATSQEFQAAGVDYSPALAGATVTLHRRANGQPFLRVIGQRPVNEPFVNLVVNADWDNGHMVRDYTMLVDPPGRAALPAVVKPESPVVAEKPAEAPTETSAPVASAPTALEPLTLPPAENYTAESEPSRAAPPARQRAASASQPAATPAAESGPVNVQRGDTASAIARAHAIPGVSLDQMLVAMLAANPKAFIRGNVNLIKAGAVIHMPTAEQAQATSAAEARRTVHAQTQDFHAYRQRLATGTKATAPTTTATAQSAQGKVQPVPVEDKSAAPQSPDRLTVSKGTGGDSSATQVAQSREAQAESERLAELDKNISELSKLQEQALAGSQGASEGATVVAAAGSTAGTSTTAADAAPGSVPSTAEAASPAAPADPSASATTAESPAVASSAESTAPAEPGAAPSSAEATAPAAPDAAQESPASPPTPAADSPAPQVRVKVNTPAPAPQPAWYEELGQNPLNIALGAGLIALLAGYGIYASRRRKASAGTLADAGFSTDGHPSGPPSSDAAAQASGGTDTWSSYSPSQLDAAGDVDPMAEADVYLAYGRDQQAEEILKEALVADPDRSGAYKRLAEIYGRRNDAEALSQIATQAHRATNGRGADWQAIAAVGRKLEPSNTLYQSADAPITQPGQVAVAKPALAAGAAAAASAVTTAAKATPEEPKADVASPAPAPTEAPAPAARTTTAQSPLDLNLDLDDLRRQTEAAPLATTGYTGLMDFESTASEPQTTSPEITEAEAAEAHAPTEPLPALGPRSTASMSFEPPTAPASTLMGDEKDGAGDSSVIEFDMSALGKEPDLDLGTSLGKLHPDEPEDPMTTKFSLAQEFWNIGDKDGARSLLAEVIANASGPLKERAEKFLSDM